MSHPQRWLPIAVPCALLLLWSPHAWAHGMGGLYYSGLGAAMLPFLVAILIAIPFFLFLGGFFVWRSWQFLSGRSEDPRGFGQTTRSYEVLGIVSLASTAPLLCFAGFLMLMGLKESLDFLMFGALCAPSLLLSGLWFKARQRLAARA